MNVNAWECNVTYLWGNAQSMKDEQVQEDYDLRLCYRLLNQRAHQWLCQKTFAWLATVESSRSGLVLKIFCPSTNKRRFRKTLSMHLVLSCGKRWLFSATFKLLDTPFLKLGDFARWHFFGHKKKQSRHSRCNAFRTRLKINRHERWTRPPSSRFCASWCSSSWDCTRSGSKDCECCDKLSLFHYDKLSLFTTIQLLLVVYFFLKNPMRLPCFIFLVDLAGSVFVAGVLDFTTSSASASSSLTSSHTTCVSVCI